MGYTTNFEGSFVLSRTLTPEEIIELDELSEGEEWRKESNDMPDSWCDWESNREGTELRYNGAEKFYYYIEWLQWLIKNFFEPKGIKLNGEVEWDGEERNDIGKIIVTDNQVIVKEGKINY